MAIYSKLIEGLTNGEEHFVKVFTVKHKSRVNNRIDLPVASVIPSAFPAEPTNYELVDTYTNEGTIVAPEDGWFEIVLHGASGGGGNPQWYRVNSSEFRLGPGSGGGGGGCAISRVKLNKGDTIVFTSSAIGSTAAVYINSSIDIYSNMLVSSATNGVDGKASVTGHYDVAGGTGGVGSGGNHANYTGGNGGIGDAVIATSNYGIQYGGVGGVAGYVGGNAGGDGGHSGVINYGTQSLGTPGPGKKAFVQLLRGNKNLH